MLEKYNIVLGYIFMIRKQQAVQQARVNHRQSIQKGLQHRLEVARASKNEALVRQLEAEIKYFSA